MSRLVQCFSSHPSVMQVEPQDAFMLPAGSLQELHVGIRPMSTSPCSQLMYINVVDVELHQVCLHSVLNVSFFVSFTPVFMTLYWISSSHGMLLKMMDCHATDPVCTSTLKLYELLM